MAQRRTRPFNPRDVLSKGKSDLSSTEAAGFVTWLGNQSDDMYFELLPSLASEQVKRTLNQALRSVEFSNPQIAKALWSMLTKICKKHVGMTKTAVATVCAVMEDEAFTSAFASLLPLHPEMRSSAVQALLEFLKVVLTESPARASDTGLRALKDALLPLCNSQQQRVLRNLFSLQPGSTAIPQHNNDFPDDFRAVSIFPTVDELNFMLDHPGLHVRSWGCGLGAEDTQHLDRQFRMLREDMLQSMTEDLKMAMSTEPSKRRGQQFLNPTMTTLLPSQRAEHSILVKIRFELPPELQVVFQKKKMELERRTEAKERATIMKAMQTKDKEGALSKEEVAAQSKASALQDLKTTVRRHLEDDGRNMLAYSSTVLFAADNRLVNIGTVAERNEEAMAEEIAHCLGSGGRPTVSVGVCFHGNDLKAVLMNPTSLGTRAIQSRAGLFSYLPVLQRLREMSEVPFSDCLVHGEWPSPTSASGLDDDTPLPTQVQAKLASDAQQLDAATRAQRQPICIVQGPPGTGKTFVGVQIVKALMETNPTARVLCLSYTNHALDSFLESLMDEGVDSDCILRFGSSAKMTNRLKNCSYHSIPPLRFNSSNYDALNNLDSDISAISSDIEAKAESVVRRKFSSWEEARSYLEGSENNDLWEIAMDLSVEATPDGEQVVGKRGRAAAPDYLWKAWTSGQRCPRGFASQMQGPIQIWHMADEERRTLVRTWFDDYLAGVVKDLLGLAKRLQRANQMKADIFSSTKLAAAQRKIRVMGCTTTFAASHHNLFEAMAPTVLVVEEAAEIHECHVLTGLTRSVTKLVMIGDHLQLRPKLECYELRKESNSGIDFDESLFERLVTRSRFPFVTLHKQHRMQPQISQLIRHTYPALQDAAGTLARANIRGTSLNVAFVAHSEPEDSSTHVETMSKTNTFEVRLVVKIIQHLVNNGYALTDIVVLTPYLGQLLKLRQALREEGPRCGVEVGERDQQELAALGEDRRSDPSSGKTQAIRVSTIDNFQGEEAKIIVASLVRSNSNGDIGFLAGAERVNVLMSRARDGLFLIGNRATIQQCRNRRGREVWGHVFEVLERRGAVVGGFPARCSTHGKEQLLCRPEDFDALAPEGGCDGPCSSSLGCGHQCRKICHRRDVAHECAERVSVQCSEGLHSHQVLCSNRLRSVKCTVMVQIKCYAGHTTQMRCDRKRHPSDCTQCASLVQIKRKKERELAVMRENEEAALTELEKLRVEEVASAALDAERERLQRNRVDMEADIAAARRRRAKNSADADADRTAASAHASPPPTPAVSAGPPELVAAAERAEAPSAGAGALVRSGPTNVPRSNKQALAPAAVAPAGPAARGAVKSVLCALASGRCTEAMRLIMSACPNLNVGALTSSDARSLAWPQDMVFLYVVCCLELGESAEDLSVVASRLRDESLSYAPSELAPPALRALKRYVVATLCKNSLPSLAAEVAELYEAEQGLPEEWAARMQSVAQAAPARKAAPPVGVATSPAEQTWRRLQAQRQAASAAMDTLFRMTGLESVKQSFVDLHNRTTLSQEQRKDLSSGNFNVRFDGNPGTGKTTVAQLYMQVLCEIGVMPRGAALLKKTGSELATGGVSVLEKELRAMQAEGGGVVFVDEAYQLDTSSGHVILNFILGHAEKMLGEYGCLVWIFAGYKKQMDDLFKLNVGLPSRFPTTFRFEDYSDEELCGILRELLRRGGDDVSAAARPVAAPPPPPSGARSSGALSPMYGSRLGYSGGSRGDEVDQWGNTWRWDATRCSFYDDHGNTTGYGAANLGAQLNPVVDKSGKQWVHRQGNTWAERGNAASTREGYPGRPVVRRAAPSPPFVVRDEKWLRITARRLGRLRGSTGFGNARAVRNAFELAHKRQTARIAALRLAGGNPDIHVLERDDLLGPRASREKLEASAAWRELQDMEGLGKVKRSLSNLLTMSVENAQREEREEPVLDMALNRVFLGNPGTGKTTVAQLYGRILVDLGLLSKGEVLLKTASDFVGSVVGRSEEVTRGILEQAKGCVLVIDEAYGLGPSQKSSGASDLYREAVINTLVEQVQGVPGEDRAVLMLGYREEMEHMLRHSNAGLSRRFQLENAFEFEDYDDAALVRILRRAARKSALRVSTEVAVFAVGRLAKARALPHFGNAGAVNSLLSEAKLKMQGRAGPKDELLRDDFTPEGYRDEAVDVDALLSGLVGCDGIRAQLQGWRAAAEAAQAKGRDPRQVLGFNYLFTGAPGTGKTTVARLLGQLFESLRLIPCAEVVEISASDLVTGYVGQTGSRTRDVFRSARGKVLFIDEAYQLNPERGGSFMTEAVDEIVKLLTDEEFLHKLVVVFAGYERDVDDMLRVNPGLRSRFTERVRFKDLDAAAVRRLVQGRQALRADADEALADVCAELVRLPGFANGRTVETFLRKTDRAVLLRGGEGDEAGAEDLRAVLREMMRDAGGEPEAQPARGGGGVATAGPARMRSEAHTARPPALEAVSTTALEVVEEEEVEVPPEAAAPAKLPDAYERLVQQLQAELDRRDLNSAEGVHRLSLLQRGGAEFEELARRLAAALNMPPSAAGELLSRWQESQEQVRALVAEAEQKRAAAQRAGRRVQVPIWRCGVCGRADQPFIVCYVQPFIVRYQEMDA